jgi:tRNA 2-thiouridine synthesizing protein B
MSLHIVNQSPYQSSALRGCLAALAEGDVLLLSEDGVYALCGDFLPNNRTIYCLQADIQARGITPPAGVQAIDDTRWVALCCEHNPIVSWFK